MSEEIAVKAWPKFKHPPEPSVVIDTTSSTSKEWKWLSPFILPAPPAKNLENLWQFSKVYWEHKAFTGYPTAEWYDWRQQGWDDTKAHRYPMGKGKKPEYSFWYGRQLNYIDARKQIYIPEYSKNVVKTNSFRKLVEYYYYCRTVSGLNLYLLDYDGYDHRALGMTLHDVVNCKTKIMGHSFVLLSLLTGEPLE